MTTLRRIVHEAHRRSVWQVLGIYLVGAWIGYQVILNVMQGFGLPDWVAPFALVLFVIGLPIVVATAFVQEGGPERRDFARAPAADPHDTVPGFTTPADELQTPAPASHSAAPAPAVHLLTWPKAILAGVLAFLLLGASTAGYMGMRNAGIGPMGSLVGRGELAASDAIVLARFSGAADDSTLAAAVTEAFRVDFEQSTIVRLVGPQQTADVLRRMQRDPAAPMTEALAREIAEREGYKAVVTGEVNPVGSGYVLSARLVAADGRVLTSQRATAYSQDEVLAAIDELSKALREDIGESLRSIRANPPLEQVTTASMDALRYYTQALAARDDGDAERSLALLQQAVAADSGFAMAWRKIAALSSSPGMDPALRRGAATRAYELRDRLTDRERHLAAAAYSAWVLGDDDAAVREYEALLDVYPDETTALNNLALIHSNRGQYAAAEVLLARAAGIGGSVVFLQNHADVLYNLGRRDEAFAEIARMRELYPDNMLGVFMLASMLSSEGRYDASDSVMGDLPRTERTESLRIGAQLLATANAAGRGHIRRALELGRITERTAAGVAPREGLGAAIFTADIVAGVLEDRARARREVEVALARYPIEQMEPIQRPYPGLVGFWLRVGDPDEARRWIEHYRAVPAEQRGSRPGDELAMTAMAHIVDGRLDAALAAAEEFWTMTPCDICGIDLLADAFAAAGQRDRAIELYERYLAIRDAYRVLDADAASLAHVLERLAALYEDRGDTDDAARNYARLVEMWQDADPELQPRVRAAQARLEAITARRG